MWTNPSNGWFSANSCDQYYCFDMQINALKLPPSMRWLALYASQWRTNYLKSSSVEITIFHAADFWSAWTPGAKTRSLERRKSLFSSSMWYSVKIYTYTHAQTKEAKIRHFASEKKPERCQKNAEEKLGFVNNYKTSAEKKKSADDLIYLWRKQKTTKIFNRKQSKELYKTN